MKITVFSHLCIDENIAEGSQYRSFGSPGMYIHLLLNNLPDNDVTIISNYGQDFEEFRTKVNIHPPNPKFEKTMLNRNHYFLNGKRKASSSFRESNISVEIDKEIQKILSESDVLIIAPLLDTYSKEYLDEVFKYISEDTITILGPQGYFRRFDELDNQHFKYFDEAQDILPLFDYVILSEEDYPEIDELSHSWSKEFDTKVIMTRGKNGARIYDQGESQDISVEPVDKIIDSVGSGDIFIASFAYDLVKNSDDISAIKFANYIAAKCLGYTAVDIIEGRVEL